MCPPWGICQRTLGMRVHLRQGLIARNHFDVHHPQTHGTCRTFVKHVGFYLQIIQRQILSWRCQASDLSMLLMGSHSLATWTEESLTFYCFGELSEIYIPFQSFPNKSKKLFKFADVICTRLHGQGFDGMASPH